MRGKGVLIALIFLLVVMSIGIADADIPLVGVYYGGMSYAVENYTYNNNDYIIFNDGRIVKIYNFSYYKNVDVDWLTEPNATIDVNSTVRGMFIDGGYLYVASIDNFSIIDITNPESPVVLCSTANPTSYDLYDVVVSGNYAYIPTYGDGLLIFNITDKTSPTLENTTTLVGASNKGLSAWISENYLYIGEYDNILSIWDISTPTAPVKVSNITWGHSIKISDVVVSGNYAYVVEYYNRFHVLNISNPAAPLEVWNSSDYYIDDGYNKLHILGNRLYASVRYNGTHIFDITNPESPTLISYVTERGFGYAEEVTAIPNYVFDLTSAMGMWVVDVANETNPTIVDLYPCMGEVYSTAVKDNYLYAAMRNTWILVFNITNKSAPVLVGYYEDPHDARFNGLQVSGPYLYAGGLWGGLLVFDISTPSKLNLITRVNTNVGELLADGNYIYARCINSSAVGNSGRHLGIFDISDPANPQWINETDFGLGDWGYFYMINKYNDTVIAVTTLEYGLMFIDVSDPSSPRLLKIYNTSFSPRAGVMINQRFCGIDIYPSPDEFTIIDFSDINNPVTLFARDANIGDSGAYCANYINDTLYVVTIGRLVAYNLTTGSYIDKALFDEESSLETFDTDDNYVYVGGEFGVAIYQHVIGGGELPPIQTAEYINESDYILDNVTANPKYFVLGISADYFDRPDNDDVNEYTGKTKWRDPSSYHVIYNYSYKIDANYYPDFDQDVGITDDCNITIKIGKEDPDLNIEYCILFHSQSNSSKDDCYYICFRTGDDRFYFGLYQGGVDTKIDIILLPVNEGDLFTVDTGTVGTGLKVYRNGHLVATCTPNSTYSSGYVGIMGVNRPEFDLWRVAVNLTGSVETKNVLDAGDDKIWTAVSLEGIIEENTSVDIYVNTSTDNITWSGWKLLKANASIAEYNLSDKTRYLRWKLVLKSTDPTHSPAVRIVPIAKSLEWHHLWWNGTSELPTNFSCTELYSYGEGDYYAIKVVEDAAKKRFNETSNNASLQVRVTVCGLDPSSSYDVKCYWTNGTLVFSRVVNTNSTGCLAYYTTNFADERYMVIEKRTQVSWFIITAVGGAAVGGAIAFIAGKKIIKRFRRWIRRG